MVRDEIRNLVERLYLSMKLVVVEAGRGRGRGRGGRRGRDEFKREKYGSKKMGFVFFQFCNVLKTNLI